MLLFDFYSDMQVVVVLLLERERPVGRSKNARHEPSSMR